MKTFDYTIKDAMGIHARPAGLLVKEAAKYESKVSLTKDGKTVDAARLTRETQPQECRSSSKRICNLKQESNEADTQRVCICLVAFYL